MNRFNPRFALKKYGVQSCFNFLSFRGKIYAAAIVFLIGIFLEGALVFTVCKTTHDKIQKSHQILSLKSLEQRLNQSLRRNFSVWVYLGWAFLLGLFILSLTVIISGGLIMLAVKSIIKPAGLISECLDATKQKRLSVELPEMSEEGLGHFRHILNDSLQHWNTQSLDSKNSIRHFDQLCKELVTEIRKTELFAIQLQKVSEELNDNLNNENQLIGSAHSQLSVITNNGEELQKIPQHLAVIHDGLKNQLTTVQDQIQNILNQNSEVHDELIEIDDLAKNLDEASAKIKGVISILNDVSERTELLAFNTAIQAARAGDKGLGFGVVAKEIAKLVEYSKKASIQLSTMLNRINGKNKDILNLIHQHSEAFPISFLVCEEVGKICDELFRIAQTNFENIEKLTSVMETLLVQSNQFSGEIRQAILLTSEDNIGNFNFDLETLDYQLNVKEANRIAFKVSELSEELRTLAETVISEEDFIY